MNDDNTPVGLREPWQWIQPTRDTLMQRIRDGFELAVPPRERENLLSCAHAEIARLHRELAAAVEYIEDNS